MIQVRRVLRAFREHDFLGGAAVYILGNTLQKAAAFLLIPLYTYYLSPGDFGITGIVQSVNQVLTIVLALGIHSAILRYYYEYYNDEEQLRRFISSTFLFLTLTATTFSLGLFLWGESLWNLIFRQVSFTPYAQLMIWTVWGSIITQYGLNLYRVRQQPVRFVVTQIGGFIIATVATIYFVAFARLGATGQLLGLMLGSITTAAFSILLLREFVSFQFDWYFVRVSLIYGLPLAPHLIAQWVKTALDRLILESYTTLEEVGIYTLGFNLGFVMQVLVLSTNQAYVPYYFDIMKNALYSERQFRRIVELYVMVFGLICLIGILFGGEVLQFLAPPEYYSAARIVPLILFGFLMNGYYLLAVNPLFFFKRTNVVPWLTGAGAVISIGLNLLFVPRFGSLGTAWSLLISTTLTFLLTALAASQVWKIDLRCTGCVFITLYIFVVAVWESLNGYTQTNVMSFAGRVSLLLVFVVIVYVRFRYTEHLLKEPHSES